MNDIATSEDNAPKKPKRASRASAAVLREPWKPTDAEERRLWEEREAAEASATPAPGEGPTLSRAQARALNNAKLREKAQANGTMSELFPTAEPFNFGSIVPSYPISIVTPTTPSVIEEAPVEVPEGELATLAHEINSRMALADQADNKANDHRLAAAIRLAEAKKICETKSMPFRKWAEAHIPHAFVTIRTLAKIGSSPEPKLALENYRLKNAEANRDLRRRRKEEVQALIAAAPIDKVMEILQDRPVTEPVRENGRFVGSVSLSPVEAMLREFDRLEQEAKAEFLKKAAEHMGVTVELPE